jgi:hypothetical protein
MPIILPHRPLIWMPGQRAGSSSLARGLFGYWPCNEGGGLRLQDAVGGLDGVYSGTTPGWTQSPFGPALKLDGSSNYFQIPNSFAIQNPGNPISLSCWLFWNASSESYNSLFTNEIHGSWTFLLKSNQQPAFYNSGAGADPITTNTIPFSKWVHLVLTWGAAIDSNSTVSVYLNGILLGSTTLGNSGGGGTGAMNIGGNAPFGSGRYINGNMRDVGMWTRVLTPAEVLQLYLDSNAVLAQAPYIELFSTTGAASQNITGSAGITSAEAFGSTGASVLNATAIAGAAGIPTAEAFGCIGGTVNRGTEQQVYGTCGTGIPSVEVVGTLGAVAIAPNLSGDAGIGTAEAFGAGGSVGVNPAITGQNGIRSAEAFGQGAVILRSGVSLFIGGADVTKNYRVNTMNIVKALSQVSTASFSFYDPTGTLRPLVGQEVIVYLGLTRVFGGTVDDETETARQQRADIFVDVKCSDFSGKLDRTIVGKYYTNGSLSIMVDDIVRAYLSRDGFSYNSSDGDPGINLGPQLFNWVTARQAFQTLANASGWDFAVDEFKVIRFFPKATGTESAPFNLADSTPKGWIAESMKVRTYRGKYRNQELIRSSTQASALWRDTFSTAIPGPFPLDPQPPDGHRIEFITSFGITAPPVVAVNGNVQVVIRLDQVATPGIVYDWYWIPQQGLPAPNPGVFQNQAHAPLTSGDVLTVGYQAQLSPVTIASCPTEIAARAAVEGDSGVYQDVQDAPNLTDPIAITQYAQAILNRYGCTTGLPTDVTYQTDLPGLKPGQLQAIQVSSPLVGPLPPSGARLFLVTQVAFKDQAGLFFRYTVTVTSGQYQGSDYASFFGALVNRGQLAQPGNRENYVWQLAPSYPGIVNPGLHDGVQGQPHVIQNPVEILQSFTLFFPTIPGTDIEVEILQNGNGTGRHTYYAGTSTPQTFFFNQVVRASGGDVLQVYFPTLVSGTMKDGILNLLTSVSVT